jgi:hypothetical protein
MIFRVFGHKLEILKTMKNIVWASMPPKRNKNQYFCINSEFHADL